MNVGWNLSEKIFAPSMV